jgi:hypothetical protein
MVDVETLVATLGYDFNLAHLPSHMRCPRCHSQTVGIEWVVPDPTPEPFSPAADVMPLRLEGTRVAQALKKLRAISGGG